MSYYPIYKDCVFCGKTWDARGGQRGVSRAKKKQYCSRSCVAKHRATFIHGENHHGWKHGLKIDKNRYIAIRTYLGPHRKHTIKYQHDQVMEDYIGRLLKRGEEVHHINEDKHDNRIENLLLLTKAEHTKLHSKDKYVATV